MAYYKKYPTLFSEGKIGNLTLPNRVVLAPMGTSHTGPDFRFSEELIQFYEDRAKGGVGMILTECCSVAPEVDPFPMVSVTPRLDSPNKIARIAQYVERMEAYGAVPAIQITLGVGRQADAPQLAQPISSSECAAYSDPSVTCRALTTDEIHTLVQCAGRAAGYALIAGVKLIEIHGHAGYLIDQFLNPEINKRTDEYGGTPENRFRIVKEVREAIRAAVGDAIPVTLRISVDHKFPGGRTMEEGIEYCKLAEAAGFDGIHVDAGRYEVMPWIFPPAYLGPNCMIDIAAEVKKAVNIPVIAVGSIGRPEDAEEALAAGKCDFVAMARSLLADPEWVNKSREGREEDIRPCLRCNEKCVGRSILGKELQCAVNPECGRETYNKVTKADKSKNVTVIGGGPAGMVAALTAEKRGHKVTLLEKNTELGGLLNLASVEDFKHGMKGYNAYLKTQIAKSNVTVHLNTTATVDVVKASGADAVIVATGSDVFIPGLPGFVASDKIGTVREFNNKELEKEDKIVIAGGGVIACETAIGLARDGYKDITIVEMLPNIGGNVQFISLMAMVGEIMQSGVKVHTETKCLSVDGQTLICENKDGEKVELPFDYMVVAMGTRSVNDLNETMKENFPEVYCVGDCTKVGLVYHAVEDAYNAAKRI